MRPLYWGEIDYSNIEKLRKKPSFKNSLFLNFNYTRTIEQVYGIKASDICHIHGEVSSRTEGIYFGNGDDEEFEGFFDRLSKVNKIYSYGFSFSEVDMPYIEEIAKIVVPR